MKQINNSFYFILFWKHILKVPSTLLWVRISQEIKLQDFVTARNYGKKSSLTIEHLLPIQVSWYLRVLAGLITGFKIFQNELLKLSMSHEILVTRDKNPKHRLSFPEEKRCTDEKSENPGKLPGLAPSEWPTTDPQPAHSRAEATPVVSSFSGLRFLVFNMGDTLRPASPQGCLRDHDTTGVCECFVGLGAMENQRKTRRWCDCRAVLGIRGGFYLQKWLRVFWELLPLALREKRILRWGADAGGFAGSDAEIHSLEGKQRKTNRPRLREELRRDCGGLCRRGGASELWKAARGALCRPATARGLPRGGRVSSHGRPRRKATAGGIPSQHASSPFLAGILGVKYSLVKILALWVSHSVLLDFYLNG